MSTRSKIMNETVTEWGGCRLATANASYWHAARDFAPRTLCGIGLAGHGLAERATAGMTMCPACRRALADEAQAPAGPADLNAIPATRAAVRAWLLDYAWAEDTQAAREAVVDCILAQDGWRYIDAVADKFAGAQWEPGPEAFGKGVGFALSALYECHDAPHLPTCPSYRERSK